MTSAPQCRGGLDERAVVAAVATQAGQRNKDLWRVRDNPSQTTSIHSLIPERRCVCQQPIEVLPARGQQCGGFLNRDRLSAFGPRDGPPDARPLPRPLFLLLPYLLGPRWRPLLALLGRTAHRGWQHSEHVLKGPVGSADLSHGDLGCGKRGNTITHDGLPVINGL